MVSSSSGPNNLGSSDAQFFSGGRKAGRLWVQAILYYEDGPFVGQYVSTSSPLEMRKINKRLLHWKSETSTDSKRGNGSKRNLVPSHKREPKTSDTKRNKVKLKAHVRARGSIKLNRGSSNFSTDGVLKVSKYTKQAKNPEQTSGANSSKKRLSSNFHGGKCLPLSQKRHRKHADNDALKQGIKRIRKRKRKRKNIVRDDASRLQRRTRYLLIRMKLEQNLIDAYSGEGWKGNSREKIKPEKELERAKKQILECKLGIRDVIRQLHFICSEGRIEDSVMHPDGSVFHEYIFCAKCKVREAFPDNDIILCDGTCNRAFHQKCLEPPLATENIPPGDQGWFCKYCECKMEILEAVNAHLGTSFCVDSNWQDIFEEAVNALDSDKKYNPVEEWPSEDSEDDDYEPENIEQNCSKTDEANIADDANSSSGLFWSSDDVSSLCEEAMERSSLVKTRPVDSTVLEESDDTDETETLNFRRQRKDVDYRKLHDEMFGKEKVQDEELSEDEDWGPCRRKRRLKEPAGGALLTASANTDSDVNASADVQGSKKLPAMSQDKRPLFRIPSGAVQKLRQVFAENELPSKDVRKSLSKQLDIASEKIDKWFKNARYLALKTRKAQNSNVLCNKGITEGLKRDTNSGDSLTKSILDKHSSLPAVDHMASPLRLCWKKRSKSVTTIKRHQAKDKGLSASKVIEVNTQLENKETLKKHMGSSERKTCSRKKCPLDSSSPATQINCVDQEYLAQLERLFSIEDRLHRLKVEMKKYSENNHSSRETSADSMVVYVPVVEVVSPALRGNIFPQASN